MKQLRENIIAQALEAMQGCDSFMSKRKRSVLRYKGYCDYEHALIQASAHGAALPKLMIAREHGRLYQEGWNMAHGLCLPYLLPLLKQEL